MTIEKNRSVRVRIRALRLILPLFLTAAVLGGCTPKNVTKGMEEGEAYDAVISVKGKQAVSETEGAGLGQTVSDSEALLALAGLLGQTDSEAAGALGGGAENRTEDGNVLVGRSYETLCFGETCSVHTSYDDTGLVWLVLAEPQGVDAKELRERICAVTGSEPEEAAEEMTEGTQEGETDPGKTLDWNWGGIAVSLYEADGGVSISLSLAQ